ncbi:hypothetical protein [Diplocloster hominis]|uniref:hypothetical protein n=1 Tax=Diplocloster hominis TaxID=3079010 RepID=UPI0031BB156A
MSQKQIVKLVCLNLGIVLFNIVVFSEGMLNLWGSQSLIVRALCITIVVVSLLVFCYGNYRIIFKGNKTQIYRKDEFAKPEDYLDVLKDSAKRTFEDETDHMVRCIEKMMKKTEVLNVILLQYFTEGEMAYQQFQNAMRGASEIFYDNVKKMINRINLFDEEEYRNALRGTSGKAAESTEKMLKICKEHIDYVHTAIDRNEDILLKLDGLILEISKLDDMEGGTLEELPAIQEINSLIEHTKYYK